MSPGTPPSIPGDAIAKLFNDHKATRTDVEQIRSEAAERFTELRKAGSVGADEVATLAVLAEVSDAAAAELGRIDTAEAEMQSQLDALDDRMATDPAPAGGELEDADTVEAPADAAAAVPEPAAAAVAPQTPATDDEEDAEEKRKQAQSPAPVVAAARVRLSQLQQGAPQPNPEPAPEPGVSLVAAADVRGFATGQELSGIEQLTAAAVAKVSQLPRHGSVGEGTRIQAGIASITVDYPDDLKAHDDNGDAAVIERALDVQGRTGKSLVAAGG